MNEVEAIYENGVFRPLQPVGIREHQRVRLSYQTVEVEDALKWLEEVKEHQRQYIAKHGYLPDSTPLIAEDRMRDV